MTLLKFVLMQEFYSLEKNEKDRQFYVYISQKKTKHIYDDQHNTGF